MRGEPNDYLALFGKLVSKLIVNRIMSYKIPLFKRGICPKGKYSRKIVRSAKIKEFY